MEKILRTQAQRLFDKFGSPRNLARAMARAGCRRNPSSVYRWNMPKSEGGTGGKVPSSAWDDVLAAAKLEGVFIDETILDPRKRP